MREFDGKLSPRARAIFLLVAMVVAWIAFTLLIGRFALELISGLMSLA